MMYNLMTNYEDACKWRLMMLLLFMYYSYIPTKLAFCKQVIACVTSRFLVYY